MIRTQIYLLFCWLILQGCIIFYNYTHMKRLLKKMKRLRKANPTLSLMNFLWVSFCIGFLIICFVFYKDRLVPISNKEDHNKLNNVDSLFELGLRDEAYEIWDQFEGNVEKEVLDAEDIYLLEGALKKLQKFINMNIDYSGQEQEMIEKIEQVINEFHTKPIAIKIKELEEKIDFEEKNNNFSSALKLSEKALNLQININQNYPNSKEVNYVKVSFLESRILKLKTLPLFLESQSLENQGNKYINNLQWEKALKAIGRAKQLQIEINQEYPNSIHFRYNRVSLLDKTIQKILSSDEHFEIQNLHKKATLLDSKKNYKESAKLFTELRDRQTKLNKTYPQSPFVSPSTVLVFEQLRQTAESHTLHLRIIRNKDLVDRLLRLSEFDQAFNLSEAIFKQLTQFFETYPKSKLDTNLVLEQVQFIKEKREHLRALRKWLDKSLHPLDEKNIKMISTVEVPQFMYKIIMDENPSRQIGNQKPVESVTWFEACTFCHKLSLITGQKVRLPLVEEYENIILQNQPDDFTKVAWYNNNSKGLTQNIATLVPVCGLYDIWGNVSEWLLKDNVEMDALLNKQAYFSSSIANAEKKSDFSKILEVTGYERVRTRGFRFVIYKDILLKN